MNHLLINKLYDVAGRVALVTGGGSGMGLMITQALATNGAKVYIGSRKSERVESSAKEHSPQTSGQIFPLELDVTDKSSIKNAVKTISDNEGKLDILVNNAGTSGPHSNFLYDPEAPEHKDPEKFGNSFEESFEDWTGTFGLNTASYFFVTAAFLGLLNKASSARGAWSASVINISSLSGQLKMTQNHVAYNASKAATIHLTKMFATEFALKNIPVRVNSIAPGVTPSEMTHSQGQGLSGDKASSIGKAQRDIPFQRGSKDTDLGGVALFLSSPASYYVHGQVITVDGGFVAVHPSTA